MNNKIETFHFVINEYIKIEKLISLGTNISQDILEKRVRDVDSSFLSLDTDTKTHSLFIDGFNNMFSMVIVRFRTYGPIGKEYTNGSEPTMFSTEMDVVLRDVNMEAKNIPVDLRIFLESFLEIFDANVGPLYEITNYHERKIIRKETVGGTNMERVKSLSRQKVLFGVEG